MEIVTDDEVQEPVVFRNEEYILQEMSWVMSLEARPLFDDLGRTLGDILSTGVMNRASGTSKEVVKRGIDTVTTTKTEGIDAASLRIMLQERRESVSSAFTMLLTGKNSKLLIKMILDACPQLAGLDDPDKVFDANTGKVSDKVADRFARSLKLNEVLLFIPAVVRANASAFGARGKTMLERLKAKAEALLEDEEPKEDLEADLDLKPTPDPPGSEQESDEE